MKKFPGFFELREMLNLSVSGLFLRDNVSMGANRITNMYVDKTCDKIDMFMLHIRKFNLVYRTKELE